MTLKQTHPKLHKVLSWSWYKYHYIFWNVQKFAEYAHQPLIFTNEFGIILVLLGQRGIVPTWVEIGGMYILVVGLAFVLGIIFIKLGALKIHTVLANNENPQLLEILEEVRQIKKQLNERN